MGHKLTKLPCMYELDEIIPYILGNECILFIGAGLSRLAGCCDWDSLVAKFLRHPDIVGKIDVTEIETSRFSHEDLIDFCQEELTNNGKEHEFLGIARTAMKKDLAKFRDRYLPLARKIREIRPFPNIITTNIDDCIEEADIVELSRVFYEPSDFDIRNLNSPSIFHIHGYMENFKQSLLTTRQYLRRYSEGWFRLFLQKIFSDYSVLFIGCSLRDNAIKNIILQTENKKKHFALVPTEDRFSSSDATIFLDLCNIRVIRYGSKDDFPRLFVDWINRNFAKKTELKKENKGNE